jgi:hypothetical protein
MAGSLGYLRQYLASDVCPPDAHAWEELLVAQATSWIVDAAIEQTISLVTGFEDARMVGLLTAVVDYCAYVVSFYCLCF